MNDSMGIDKSNVEAIVRWLDDHPGISNREAGRQLGIHESYIRRSKSARPKGTVMLLKISDIIRTSATQPRLKIDPETVERYVQAKRDGAKFRPPVVFDDGTTKRLGDGFHRTEADIVLGVSEVECEVRQGGEREAYRHAIEANRLNGLPLSSADIKAAVLRLAIDEPSLSKRELARIVGVDEKQVRRWLDPKPEVRTVSAPAPPDTGQFVEEETWPDSAGQDSAPGRWSDPDPAPPLPSLAVKHPKPRPDTPPEPPPMTGELADPIERHTDAEWLEGLPVRSKLSETSRAVFDRDALLYRELTDDPDFKRWSAKARKAIDSKSHGLRGHYHAAFLRFLRVKHPGSCLVCGECNGKGCETCKRRGYELA